MTSCCQKQKHEKRKPSESQLLIPEQNYRGHAGNYGGKQQRVREPSMSPEVTVVNSELEADYVCIGKSRA